jgi:hypothetical protein
MIKKLHYLSIILISLFTDIAYPLSKTDLLQDVKFSQGITALMHFLDYIKGHPGYNLLNISTEIEAEITRKSSGIWIDKGNFKIRFFNPSAQAVLELDANDELIYEDTISDRLKVQLYFKGLDAKERDAIVAFLTNHLGISSLGRMVLEEIADITVKSPRYKKRLESKIIMHISDSEGIMRLVAVYTLINSRFKEVCIDFGDGEEPYAYIDTKDEKIKLLNPNDTRINLDEIARIIEIDAGIDNDMLIDSEKEEPAGEPMAAGDLKVEDIEGELSQELKERLIESKLVNKGIRKFIKAVREGKMIAKTGDVFNESEFNRILLIYDRDDLVSMFENNLSIDPRVAERIIDCAIRILEYREKVTMQSLEDAVMPLPLENVIFGIFNGWYVTGPSLTDPRKLGIDKCFECLQKGWSSLYDVLKNSYRIRDNSKLDEFLAKQVTDVFFDIYISLEEDEGIEEFRKRIAELDIFNYMSPPVTRHRLIRKIRTTGIEVLEADEGMFETVLDVMGIYKGLDFLGQIEQNEADKGSNLFLILLNYLSSFEIGPQGYIPVQMEDAWRSFNLWKKRAGEVTYQDVECKLLELYMRYIRNGKDGTQKWGWTFLWLGYFEEGSKMYNAVSDLLKEVSLRQDADINAIINDLCIKYRLSADERQKLLLTAPIDGFIMLAEIYCKDAFSGKLSFSELEEMLKQKMNAVTDEDVRSEVIFNGDTSSWLYTFRNIPDELEKAIKEKLKTEIVELIFSVVNELNLKCQKKDLLHLLELIYTTRFPTKGERLIDNITIIDLRKILFDYVRRTVKNDQALKELHAKKNLDLSCHMDDFSGDSKDKDTMLANALSGNRKEKGLHVYGRTGLNEFYTELADCETLVVFLHKHAETIGLLFWMQELLKENSNLKIRIIPQKSLWELNSTKDDIMALLQKEEALPVDRKRLKGLINCWHEERFVILDDCAPGLSWLKGSERVSVKEEINNADIVLGIGWDNFVSLQGLNRPAYFAFSIDNPIKENLTGCSTNGAIFVKTCGGMPAIQIGMYNLYEYLAGTNSETYKQLLSYFGGDREELHEWIRKEAKRASKSELEIIQSEAYCKEPLEIFGECALRETDSDLREKALDILLTNYEQIGIGKKINTDLVDLGGIQIRIGRQADCYYFYDRLAAVLVKDGKKLIIEVLKGQDEIKYLRIGGKVYVVEEIVDLVNIISEPVLWIGNSELAEFFGVQDICEFADKGKGAHGVSIKDIPQDINCQIPQTKSAFVYEIAEEYLDNPDPYLPLRLHYIMVLLSSPDVRQRVRGINELENLRATKDKEILEIMKCKGLSRVADWIKNEVPSVDSDIFSLTNFTSEEERILRVLGGGYLLNPPLVVMPGQGVSIQFHNLVRHEIAKFNIGLERSNYAEGSGSILFQDGTRHYIRTGDLLLELSKKILEGQILGAVRLKENEDEVIQVPANAGILNYLKVIHHLAHIMAARFMELHGHKTDPMQEFTPTIEDIIMIKYMQRLSCNLEDGFGDFKEEISNSNSEEDIKTIFKRYGLNYPSGSDYSKIKTEIFNLGNMQEFCAYIESNNLGSFISAKEFLNVLARHVEGSVGDYIQQLPPYEQIILERLLLANSDGEINNLLIIASLLAGCYIPKVDFGKNVETIIRLMDRPKMVAGASKDDILKKIDVILEGGEPFSAKAVKIVGTIVFGMGIKISAEERREIEYKAMDILSGKWLQELVESLRERLLELEASGVDTRDLDAKLAEISMYMVGESQRLLKSKAPEQKPVNINEIRTWSEIERYVDEYKIKRVFFDIDKTTLDAPGYITTTPWFKEMTEREGLEETIRVWRELEEGLAKRGMVHLMEDCIPEVINMLKSKGIEVFFYTARGEDDLSRTKKMLEDIGINMDGIEIIVSKGGTPEQKCDALIEYYKIKGWFKGKRVPSLFMDDTLANVKAVCGDKRFSHIKGFWYRALYQKQYERLTPEQFLEAGDTALSSGNTMEALEWYYNAFYVRLRKNIAGMLYDTVAEHLGIESSLEGLFYKYMKDRLSRYGSALERESVWVPSVIEKESEEKDIMWVEGAPDIASSEFWQGVKRVIVIGSHPHGDHVKGFMDYAKRRMKNIVETVPPEINQMKTGGPITHSLSNYWGRIGEETIVLFDLGWFPEGFVDPLIQTVSPRDREIFFIMDPDTARTLDFQRQLERLHLEDVKFQVLPYENVLNIPIEKGKILQIENYPAYHLVPEVGSSIYILRVLDAHTRIEIQSIGYISELGDVFPEKVDKKLLKKLARLDHIIVDGTNLIAPMGEEPLPIKDRPNKIYKYVKMLNQGSFLVGHFNTQSIRMGEEAAIINEKLDPNIPIIIIGGKEAIEQLRRSYKVPKGLDYYTIGKRKIYLVHEVADFHRRLRSEGNIPKLDDVLEERIKGLRSAGWSDGEISEFVREWRDNDGKEIHEYEGPEGKVKELEALLWDLRKTQGVIISSSQFRGNPAEKRFQNFKGFQILDAIVDKKDACILIEGRLHMDDKEGAVLKVLLSKRREDREISCITGRKRVRAAIDNQWRSGHITFRELMRLLNRVADKSVEIKNTYNVRTFIPVPQIEWFRMVPKKYADRLLRRFNYKSLEDAIDIINRWNNRLSVSDPEILFVRKVIKMIFKQTTFWETLNISDPEALRDELLDRLDMVRQEIRLQGRANNRIFVASTSKFIEVIRRQLSIDPKKREELFKTAGRFMGFQVGISYEQGRTIDFAQKEKMEYSRNLLKELNREYLKDLFLRTEKGEIPSDLSEYRMKEVKGIKAYREELIKLLDKAKGRAKRQNKEIFGIWFSELKKYIESQYLRLGLRYADNILSCRELREECSWFYDAVIESVYNYLQEDMGWEYKDISITAGGDYAQYKVLFKDIILLEISSRDEAGSEYTKRLCNRMNGILNKLGVPVEFRDLSQSLHKRKIIPGFEEKGEETKKEKILSDRKKRVEEDAKILEARRGFDIHSGPGGLDDIELIKIYYGSCLTEDEKDILNETEEFLRRYKEEIGLSIGGNREKVKELFSEIIANLDFIGTQREFREEFFRKIEHIYVILRRVISTAQVDDKIYEFSQLVCERIKETFTIDVSLNEIGDELKNIKFRFLPKLNPGKEGNLQLINDTSMIVTQCGAKAGVSDEIMIKAVMIVTSQIIEKLPDTIPPAKPVPHDELEDLYAGIVQSV